MVLSMRTKLKIFAAAILLVLVVIGGGLAYFNFYVKTPEYTLKAIQESIQNHDVDEFNKYVNVDNVVAGVTNNMLDGIIASQTNLPEEAKVAMNSLATMFKAPIVASLQEGLNNYVKTGSWQSGNTTADAQGAMINSDMILEQSGLIDLTFEGIDYVNTNEDNGTAEAGIKVTQGEINQPFVFKVSLEEQADGYWKVVSVDNFADFIKALEDGRKEFIKDYLSQTALIIIDKEKILTENEANLNAALNLGTLGSSQTRTDLKNDIENKILPQLKELQEALQSVEVPKSAETLHNLRLKAYESKIAYYQDYAKWLDNKDIKTLREATDNLKKAKTMEYEANLLTKRIEGQIK
ncbi:Uncharacterised protein [Megamonas hypermegale]|uniref:DUF2939 domain-containing protein n=1 Tax=Megamonas hypermegale TaxID=158847 RepID=A0A378NVN7_9FIRM|nr:DUF2939 domain-containing protein [Megamonas hypermegale]STY70028.1 Uncharacterised protein [Megamonas hypermegale]